MNHPKNSNPELMQDIWEVAASLGYSKYFIPRMKYAIHDDHIPFVRAGITSVDIIDFDYPFGMAVKSIIHVLLNLCLFDFPCKIG